MDEKMPVNEAKEIIFGYACCAVGMCEICPFAAKPDIHRECDGEKLEKLKDAVEVIAKQRKHE